MELIEWAKHYIKFKDCMKKNIVEMNVLEHDILVKEKQQDVHYYVHQDLATSISKLEPEGKQTIICHNTKANFDTLVKDWKNLITHKQLTIIFAHPSSNETWSVHPKIHQGITEEKHLKESLLTLFSNVTRV